MTDTETAQVQQIREREQQATKGPWGVRFDHDVTGYPCYFIRGVSGDGKRDVQSLAANARFIEGARTDIPFLLALLARQQAEIDRLRGERDESQAENDRMCATIRRLWKALKGGEGYPGEEISGIAADYVKRAESAESSLTDLREALTKLADEYELYLGGDALLDSVRALLASPHTPTEAR